MPRPGTARQCGQWIGRPAFQNLWGNAVLRPQIDRPYHAQIFAASAKVVNLDLKRTAEDARKMELRGCVEQQHPGRRIAYDGEVVGCIPGEYESLLSSSLCRHPAETNEASKISQKKKIGGAHLRRRMMVLLSPAKTLDLCAVQTSNLPRSCPRAVNEASCFCNLHQSKFEKRNPQCRHKSSCARCRNWIRAA